MAVVSNQRIRLKLVERPTLRTRVVPRFPSTVEGENGIEVRKENGGYIVGPNWSGLTLVTALDDPENKQVWVYDPDTRDYWRVSLQALIDVLINQGSLNPAIVTTSSYDVTDETIVLVNRTSPSGDTTINLPPVDYRGGRPLRVADLSTGISGSGHNIVLVPDAVDVTGTGLDAGGIGVAGDTFPTDEHIMRQTTWTLFSSGDDYLSSTNLWPAPQINGWYIA